MLKTAVGIVTLGPSFLLAGCGRTPRRCHPDGSTSLTVPERSRKSKGRWGSPLEDLAVIGTRDLLLFVFNRKQQMLRCAPSKVNPTLSFRGVVHGPSAPPKGMKISTGRASLKTNDLTRDFRQSEAMRNLLLTVKNTKKQISRSARNDR